MQRWLLRQKRRNSITLGMSYVRLNITLGMSCVSSGVSSVCAEVTWVVAKDVLFMLTPKESFNQLNSCNQHLHGSIEEHHDLLHGFRDFYGRGPAGRGRQYVKISVCLSCHFNLCLNDQAHFAWFTSGAARGQLGRLLRLVAAIHVYMCTVPITTVHVKLSEP